MKKAQTISDSSQSHGNNNTFLGTRNPRQVRAINALLESPITREQLDRVAGCSNSPDLISRLRARGLEIRCKSKNVRDRDDKLCQVGVYELTELDRQKIAEWQKCKEAV